MKTLKRTLTLLTAAALLGAGCGLEVFAGGQVAVGITDLGRDGTYKTYRISDPVFDYLTINGDTGESRYWMEQETDLVIVTMEEGADAPDPSEVLAGASAAPIRDYPYTNDFHASVFGKTGGPYVSALLQENTYVVTGAADNPAILHKLEGVDQVFRTEALISTEAWAVEPCFIAFSIFGSQYFDMDKLTEEFGIADVTEIVSVENPIADPYNTDQYAYYVYTESLAANFGDAAAFNKAALELSSQFFSNGTDAYPLMSYDPDFSDVPNDYILTEVPYSSITADEEDTITITSYYQTWEDIWIYPKTQQTDVIHRKEYDNSYAVKVICTDTAAFTEEFSSQYAIFDEVYQIEETENENCLIIAASGKTDLSHSISGWSLDDAEAAAKQLLLSDSVEQVEILDTYWEMSGWHMSGFGSPFTIYSDIELTEDDFTWLDTLGLKLENGVTPVVGKPAYAITVYANDTYKGWDLVHTIMLGCYENIPSANSISVSHIENAIALSNKFRSVYTVNRTDITTGSPDGDDTVSVEDASLVLEYYAKNAAGAEDVTFTDAAARTAADPAAELAAFASADVNGDGIVTLEDASLILSYYAGQAAGNDVSWEALTAS